MKERTQQSDFSKSDYQWWVEYNTRHLDIVASWEQLTSVYEQLNFLDNISDEDRMKEFNSIIHQMNKQLSRMRRCLLSCKDIDAAIEYLETQFQCIGITSRQKLAYAKLKQHLIKSLINELEELKDE